MNIQTYSPSPVLHSFIKAFWTGDFNMQSKNDYSQTVVPNGTIELIIHLEDENCLLRNITWNRTPEFTFIGLHTVPYEVKFPSHVKVFGIRLYPESLTAIFDVTSAPLLGIYEDTAIVTNKDIQSFCLQIKNAHDTWERMEIAENYFSNKLSGNKKRNQLVQQLAQFIRHHKGLLTQHDLISEIPVSARQLQRAFKQQLGISPKEYMRIERLNAVHEYMLGHPKPKLTELGYEYGFADQSHFIKEFRALTGTAPSAFIKNRSHFIVNG